MSCTSSIAKAPAQSISKLLFYKIGSAAALLLLCEDDATALVAAAAAAAVAPPTGPALATIPTSNARAAGMAGRRGDDTDPLQYGDVRHLKGDATLPAGVTRLSRRRIVYSKHTI